MAEVDVRLLTQEQADKLADDLTWDAYNKLVDEVEGLDSDAAFTTFEDTFGFEIQSACNSLVKPALSPQETS